MRIAECGTGLIWHGLIAMMAILLLSACGAEELSGLKELAIAAEGTSEAWIVVSYEGFSGLAVTKTDEADAHSTVGPALVEAVETDQPQAPNTTALRQTASPTATLLPTPTLRPTHPPTATLPPTPTLRPTQSPTPSESPTPTHSPTPAPSPTPTATPTMTPGPINVGGIPLDEIVIMSPAVRETIRVTGELGRQLGRNPHAFSKIGDSVTLTPHYLARFDTGQYVLGDYAYLQPAIDQYAGSFERYGVATRIGLHAWSLFDPLWANKEWCLPNEDMVACEVRLHNPSLLLIRLGSNDAGAESAFNNNMRALVEYALENGIVPILATKADRFEGQDNRNNKIIRQIAQEYSLPLWDFDHVANIIPGRGLGSDSVHMTMADSDDYTDPKSFERGYPVSDLTALMTIYEVFEEIQKAGDA